ncbi:alginate lyase family protein [Amycolatopsis pigmentata]|uniref:Alginate lyase family protein n=1 Tax=Amycolatopsis pigmentata TaxID=450801 RepID=A0ABW5FTW3_9PSEU
MTTSPGWYLRRLSRMGPYEIAGRAVDTARRRQWRDVSSRPLADQASWPYPALSREALAAAPAGAKNRLLASADRIMNGYAEYFGVIRDDMVSPDWAFCPKTGRRAPDGHAFDIPYRDEEIVGDIKQIWEPSRHQHLTVLAAAYALTGQDHYATRVADQLKSWWTANPPGRGVHWISGIELGIRLISWVWVRRLLQGWPGAPALFEENPEARHQIWHHQRWLATFPSRGSSANNHVIAEAAGRLAAASAFGWFPESSRWQAGAARSLDEHLRRNTFDSGLNRELATEYHGLVLELGLAAAIEAEAAGFTVPRSTWTTLVRMTDALASIVDQRLRPPRQGDADDGHGLVLDGTGTDRWVSLLATGKVLFGRLPWWPEVRTDDVRTPLLAAVASPPSLESVDRPSLRRDHFADAGLTILRAGDVWCRCDGGPHGFLSIAAHAHADALSLEVRHRGVDILADPGTFCYHGQPAWRSYFRSTLGHNTLELGGHDQSVSGGPFLWTRHAQSKVLSVQTPKTGAARWCAEHDGYRPLVHRRSVELDESELKIVDEVREARRHPCRLAFHLGPTVEVRIEGTEAELTWPGGRAVLTLPAALSWRAHRGETDPPLGWYSPGFGRREPAYVLIGTGFTTEEALTTMLRFEVLP